MKKLVLILFILLVRCAFAQEWTAEMQTLALKTEATYKLPAGTCHAFALQESNYNQWAIRAEANYIMADGAYAARVRRESYEFAKAHHWLPSVLTEVTQRGTSHGMYQIMGINLRALGYDRPFFGAQFTLEEQFETFGIFISNLYRKHKGNLGHAASEYNGGGGAVRGGNYRNAGYVANILRYQQEFSKRPAEMSKTNFTQIHPPEIFAQDSVTWRYFRKSRGGLV